VVGGGGGLACKLRIGGVWEPMILLDAAMHRHMIPK